MAIYLVLADEIKQWTWARILEAVWASFRKTLATHNHSCTHYTSVPADPKGSPRIPLKTPLQTAAPVKVWRATVIPQGQHRRAWLDPSAAYCAGGGSRDLGLAEGPGQLLNIFVLSPVPSGSGQKMH